jgi:ketosteroid isomerase-like protein
MATSQCTAFIQSFLDAMGRSDTDAMRPLMTENVRWWFPQSAADTGAIERTVQGRETLLPLLRGGEYYKEIAWTLQHVVTEGDMVAAHATTKGTTRTGKDYQNEYHFLFRLQDGLIDEVWEILDTAYANQRLT